MTLLARTKVRSQPDLIARVTVLSVVAGSVHAPVHGRGAHLRHF
jgi:hypothetical protein